MSHPAAGLIEVRRSRAGFIELKTAIVIVALVATVVLLQWLPKVGSAVKVNGKAQVEIWSWNIAAMSLQNLVPDFEKGHPASQIDVKMNGANVATRFLLSLAADTGAPDVCQLQEREAAKFTETGRLLDVTPQAQKYAKDFSPAFWNSCLDKGRVYAMPWDMGPCAVYYKRWIFDKYGIDPNAIETWDDFLAAGVRLKEATGGETKLFPLSTAGLADHFFMLMQQNGGGIFDEEGRIILDSPQNLEVLGLLRRSLDSGAVANVSWGPEMYATFGKDRLASYPGAVWNTKTLKDNSPKETEGRWGVMRLPAIHRGGVRNSNIGGSVLVIPAQSQHPDAAWQFIEFTMCDVKNQITQFRDYGLFPAYLPAHKDPIFDEGDPFFANQKIYKLFADDIQRVPPVVRTSDWNEASRYVGQTLSDWQTRGLDDGQYLRSVAEALSRKLNRRIARAGETAASNAAGAIDKASWMSATVEVQ